MSGIGYFDHPPPYLEARSTRRKEYGKSRFKGTRLISQKLTQMTHIPATILAIEQQPGQPGKQRVFVRILLRKYRGSFNTLKFGENKPLMGSYQNGRLDLIFYRDPNLKAGQSFPLWTIQ
jgi:hypothetical protein